MDVLQPVISNALVSGSPSEKDFEAASDPEAKILIIEDEAGIRAILEELLSVTGYLTTTADNGNEGLERFREQGYDLVFTDLGMPGMSGWDVVKSVKQMNAKTPVIIITGWDTEALAAEISSSGVDGVLTKPFDIDQLLDLVSNLTKN